MNSKPTELLKLIAENPDLPIVPMVEYEVVADDSYHWWMGTWGICAIDYIYNGKEAVHFKSDDEEEVLCDMVGCEYYQTPDGRDICDLTDEEWNDLYQSIPWKKCIVVFITT